MNFEPPKKLNVKKEYGAKRRGQLLSSNYTIYTNNDRPMSVVKSTFVLTSSSSWAAKSQATQNFTIQ